MMNFTIQKIPMRSEKLRTNGITMVSDRGLSLPDAHNLLSVAAPYIDMVKLFLEKE
jgi:phosphosulfolactate synthase